MIISMNNRNRKTARIYTIYGEKTTKHYTVLRLYFFFFFFFGFQFHAYYWTADQFVIIITHKRNHVNLVRRLFFVVS